MIGIFAGDEKQMRRAKATHEVGNGARPPGLQLGAVGAICEILCILISFCPLTTPRQQHPEKHVPEKSTKSFFGITVRVRLRGDCSRFRFR